VNREPLAIRAAIVAAVAALINVAVAFGWDATTEQLGAVNAAVGVVSALVVVLWTRGAVTPVDDPRDAAGSPLVADTSDEDY
jgi:hypothetical protein